MRQTIPIATLAKLTATVALADLDIGRYTRTLSFVLNAKNDAGTNPTLDVKLQQAAPGVQGYTYTTAGAVDNKLKAGAATTVNLGASWTQSGAKSISAVSLMLKTIGTLAAGKKVTVQICADNAGAPGTVLGSGVIDIDTLITTAYDYVRVLLAAPVDVADATKYHVVLSADYTASTSNCVCWRTKGSLASGGNFETYDATNWTADATSSAEVILEQRTYADITGGAFTQVTGSGRQVIHLNEENLSRHVRGYATIGGTSNPAFYLDLAVIAEDRYS